MINKFLIDLTEQRSSKMDKRYNRALGLPIFVIFCILIPALAFIVTKGLEDQPITVVGTFIISSMIAGIVFFAMHEDAEDVFNDMLEYSILQEISERKVIFDRSVDNDPETLYVDMFVNGYRYYFSTKETMYRRTLIDRIKNSKYADIRVITHRTILPSKRVYFGNQTIADSEIPDKFLNDRIDSIEIYKAIVKVKVGKNICTETANVIDIAWAIDDEKNSELEYRIAEEAEERLKI